MRRALIGAGGHAREVMMQMGEILPCFVDDKYVTKDTLPLSSFNPDEYEVMVVIGESKSRYDMVSKLPINTQYFSYTHPSALVGRDVVVGEGAFIGAKSETDDNIKALKITLGAFIGFILGTAIKLIYTIYLFIYIFTVF